MQRFVVLLALVAGLCGCVTTGSPTGGGAVPVEKLRAENKSIVIVHTSLHDRRCSLITAELSQRDASGQYVDRRTITLKGALDLQQVPSRIELPAGEYGIVGLTCTNARGHQSNYNARIAKRGSIIDGSGAVYEKPIAEFTVAPGEVVDIGSLRLSNQPRPTPATFAENMRPGGPPGAFIGIVAPIPDLWLKNLAGEDPKLFEARVVRPMTASNDCHQVGENRFRCSVQRPKRG
jgi:hypothetical protein